VSNDGSLKNENDRDVQVRISRLFFEMEDKTLTNAYVVLAEVGGSRQITISTGVIEGFILKYELVNKYPDRKFLHVVFKNILVKTGTMLEKAVISKYENNRYYAELHFDIAGEPYCEEHVFPNNAILTALHFGSPIYVRESVLFLHGEPQEATAEDLDDIAKKYLQEPENPGGTET